MSGFWYLATPYSKYERGPGAAFQDAIASAVICIRAGIQVFSPIAHTHPIATLGDLPGHFGMWAQLDEAMIRAADGMIVVRMDGWDKSAGIAPEIAICERLRKPVLYMEPDGPAPRLANGG